jgi:roadblock/LC7 domain-containing protein
LVDENNQPVAKGHCGAKNEMTRVQGPSYPNIPGYDFMPFTPDAGFIVRQAIKIAVLGSITALGAWQLTSRNSWLMRVRR